MIDQIVSAIVPVAITALIGVLVAGIKAVGSAAVELIGQKKAAIIQQIGADTYAQRIAFAKQAWNIVDEYFRITPAVTKTIEAAQAKFAEEIKKLVPSITDDEIAQLRQTVAGEVNAGKAALIAESGVVASDTTGAE